MDRHWYRQLVLHGKNYKAESKKKNLVTRTCAPWWSSISTMTASPVMHAQCSGNKVPCSLFTSAPCSSRCATTSLPWSASCQWLIARISRSDRSYDCWTLSRMYHIDGRANCIAKLMHLHCNAVTNCNQSHNIIIHQLELSWYGLKVGDLNQIISRFWFYLVLTTKHYRDSWRYAMCLEFRSCKTILSA